MGGSDDEKGMECPENEKALAELPEPVHSATNIEVHARAVSVEEFFLALQITDLPAGRYIELINDMAVGLAESTVDRDAFDRQALDAPEVVPMLLQLVTTNQRTQLRAVYIAAVMLQEVYEKSATDNLLQRDEVFIAVTQLLSPGNWPILRIHGLNILNMMDYPVFCRKSRTTNLNRLNLLENLLTLLKVLHPTEHAHIYRLLGTVVRGFGAKEWEDCPPTLAPHLEVLLKQEETQDIAISCLRKWSKYGTGNAIIDAELLPKIVQYINEEGQSTREATQLLAQLASTLTQKCIEVDIDIVPNLTSSCKHVIHWRHLELAVKTLENIASASENHREDIAVISTPTLGRLVAISKRNAEGPPVSYDYIDTHRIDLRHGQPFCEAVNKLLSKLLDPAVNEATRGQIHELQQGFSRRTIESCLVLIKHKAPPSNVNTIHLMFSHGERYQAARYLERLASGSNEDRQALADSGVVSALVTLAKWENTSMTIINRINHYPKPKAMVILKKMATTCREAVIDALENDLYHMPEAKEMLRDLGWKLDAYGSCAFRQQMEATSAPMPADASPVQGCYF